MKIQQGLRTAYSAPRTKEYGYPHATWGTLTKDSAGLCAVFEASVPFTLTVLQISSDLKQQNYLEFFFIKLYKVNVTCFTGELITNQMQ